MNNLEQLQHFPQNALLIQKAQQTLAKRYLADFAQQVNPLLEFGWFHHELAEELENFYRAVEAKQSPRLMIFAPPRHGKSELFSRLFPAWALGNNPDLSVIATSYSTDLASRMNRDLQRYIDDEPYSSIFPEVRLGDPQGDVPRTASLFELVGKRGAYRSAGVGVGITGMGADIGIIDDPVKDSQQANSQTFRDSVYEWYQSTLLTRISPGGGILLAMTRWHVDDLAGRILEKEEGWRVLSYRAIADSDEQHRKAGEALHPERWPVDELENRKRSLSDYQWSAMFNQSPVVAGGSIIQAHWFERFRNMPELRKIILVADTANKTATHNDYSVFLLAGLGKDNKLYLLDMLRGKWEAPELLRQAQAFYAKHKQLRISEFHIEDAQSGTGLIQSLKSVMRYAIKPIRRTKDKFTRLNGVVAEISQGKVLVPEVAIMNDNQPVTTAAWVSDFLVECENFTAEMSHAHDDQVDCLIDAIEILLQQTQTIDIRRGLYG